MSALGDPQQHDDLLNFRLKRLLTLSGAPAVRLCEGGFGVARQEWRLLAALVEHGGMSPSSLAEHTGMESARVSQTVTRLVQKGLVERVELPSDRRRASLRATQAALELYAALFPQLAGINRRLMAALDDEETAMLERCLDKLTQRAREIHDEGGGVQARADRHRGGSQRFWR